MKKVILLVVALCVCLPSFAKDQKHKLELGYSRADYTFWEPNTEHRDHFTAKKWGLDAVYTMQSVISSDLSDDDPSFASLELHYMNGSTDTEYVGHPKQDDNTTDHYVDAAFKMGRRYQLGTAFQLRPYLGIGWREARRGEEPYPRSYYYEQVAPGYEGAGYIYLNAAKTKTTYFYVPVGSFFTMDIGDILTFSLNGEYDWLIRGRQNIHSPGFLVNSDNVDQKQSKGYGLRFSAKAELDFGPFGVFVEPFWQMWKVQRSAKQWYILMPDPSDESTWIYNGSYAVVPANRTREYGIRAGITF